MPDNWSKSLKDQNYSPIRLPSLDWSVLTLVFEKNSAYGHDSTAFDDLTGSSAVPDIQKDIPAVDISGSITRTLDISAGVSLFKGILALFGSTGVKLEGGFKTAKSIEFKYHGITKDFVSPLELEKFIEGKPIPDSNLLRGWLNDHLYVVNTILKAKSISVVGKDSNGATVKLNVPMLGDTVSGSAKFEIGGEGSVEIGFKGGTAMPFAVQLYRLSEKNDKLTLRAAKAGITVKSVALSSASGVMSEDEFEIMVPAVIDREI